MWNKEIGKIGEDIACMFLVKQGYTILDRNFLKKYGEIDIVAMKDNVHCFIEVKTVSCESIHMKIKNDRHRPEDNVHPYKAKRLRRVIQVYLIQKRVYNDWKFHVITVLYDNVRKESKVDLLEDLIL